VKKREFDITQTWKTDPRCKVVERPYTAEDVDRLRGTVHVEHTLARLGAERLWQMMHEDDYVAALGAMTGNQAIEMVQAGLKAIYVSGWQVAGDANIKLQGAKTFFRVRATRPNEEVSTNEAKP